MSKEVKPLLEVTTAEAPSVNKLADSVLFNPGPVHRKLKTMFWARFTPGPLTDVDNIELVDVEEVLKTQKVEKYWYQKGFKEWFINRDENRERLEYLFSLALDAAEDILTNPDAQPSARVNMIKVLGELANKFPSRQQQERYVDDEINRMSDLQLKAWLERRGIATTKPLAQIGESTIDVYTIDPDQRPEKTAVTEEDKDSR